jgi:hypothetical protein
MKPKETVRYECKWRSPGRRDWRPGGNYDDRTLEACLAWQVRHANFYPNDKTRIVRVTTVETRTVVR